MRSLMIVALLAAFSCQHAVLAQPFQELLKLVDLFNSTEPIELEFCKDFGHSVTPKFNFLGIPQKKALSNPTIKGLLLLEKMGCTSMSKAFICSLVAPKPLDTFGAAPPCRSICTSIEDSCQRVINMLMSILQGSCKDDVVGASYRGKVSKSRSGAPCQKWSSQSPQKHIYTYLPENYCRNPDKEPYGPWCYIHGKRRWEYCDIPICQKRYDMRCELLPADGCMDLNAKGDPGQLEMKLKGLPKLTDLMEYNTNKLPLIKKYLGSA